MKAKNSTKVDVFSQVRRHYQSMGRTPRSILLIGLFLFFILAASTTLLLAYYLIHNTQITTLVQFPKAMPAPSATPQCVKPTLTLGPYIYPIDVVTVSSDGTMTIVSGPAGTAWWVSDTDHPFVFIFEPANRSLELKSALSPGEKIEIQWADCSQEEFVFNDVQLDLPDMQSLLQQTAPGIDVIVQPVGSDQGYVLHGQQP